jgi:hypothetical protein
VVEHREHLTEEEEKAEAPELNWSFPTTDNFYNFFQAKPICSRLGDVTHFDPREKL